METHYDTEHYKGFRLPVDIAPEHYQLNLDLDLEKNTFDGSVNIDFIVTHTTVSEITLNAIDLKIQDSYVIDVDNVRLNAKKIIYNCDNETITLQFVKDEFNPRSMRLDFDGFISDKLKGFYRTKIRIGDEDIDAFATQMCPTDARRVFPCFDEPISKSSFEISITYDKKIVKVGDLSHQMICLSNGDLVSEESLDNGKTRARFDSTPNMSTYLLAFVVGSFEYVEAIAPTKNKCRIRVYTTPGKKQQGQFALDVATKALKFYEEYFNVNYPLPKLDLITIPDSTFGAMENWGLITYRETALLYDVNTTSTAAKQRIAIIVAHEIAHQWFGNLVTMSWWNDIWLNEGFASFMQYLCVDNIYPEWDLWSQFVSDMWQRGAAKDALQNSHPVEVPVERGSEIMQIFDEISYNKGCSIIRMIYDFIGDDKFRIGMNDYLEKFSYENTTTDSLWNCLERSSQKPISQLMSTWTNRMGYPWIRIIINDPKDKPEFTVTLEQKRFTANGRLEPQDIDSKWMIPITIKSNLTDVNSTTILMENIDIGLRLPIQGDHWIKLNKDTIGFYRVEYPRESLVKLMEVIKSDLAKKSCDHRAKEAFSAGDRLGIQDDYFALCQAGHIETSDLFELLSCFEDETNYVVWNSIDKCIGRLSIVFHDHPALQLFQSFGCHLYSKIFSKLSWQPEPDERHTSSLLRSLVINRLVALKDSKVISQAIELFHSYLKVGTTIPADLRRAVYNSVSMAGSESDFDKLIDMRRETDAQEEKNRLVAALALTKDKARLEQALELILSNEVRPQDKVDSLASLASSDPIRCWNLFKERLDYFKEIYGYGIMMSRLIKCSIENFATKFRADEIERFFESEKFPGSEIYIKQSIENIRINAEWCLRVTNDDKLVDYLKQLRM